MNPLSAFGFALAIAFQPDWSGAATSPRWLVAAVGACFCLVVKPQRVTMAHVWGGAFIAWSLLTFRWSQAHLDSYAAIGRLAIAGALFLLGAGLADMKSFYKGAALGLVVSIALAYSSAVGFPLVPQASGNAGLFVNSVFLSEAVALIAAALIPVGYWQSGALLVLAAPVVHGRGGVLALGMALAASFGRPGLMVAGVVGITLSAVLIGLAAHGALPMAAPTISARLWLWRDTIAGASVFGHGLGSFGYLFPAYATVSNPSEHHAHSMLLETFFETGYPGFGLLVAFGATLLFDTPRLTSEKLLLIAFTMEGLYAFPDQMPFTLTAAALAAGHLSRDLPVVRWRYSLFGIPDGPSAPPLAHKSHASGRPQNDAGKRQ